MGEYQNKNKCIIIEWNKVTKPLLERLEQLRIDIPLVCADGRNREEFEDGRTRPKQRTIL